MDKEIKIIPPEGYEIDKENSTFECVKFKRITERWRDDKCAKFQGYFIKQNSRIDVTTEGYLKNVEENYNVFATEKQAKSALAMARISQIIANDKRFGGSVTDKEWIKDNIKYVIERINNVVKRNYYTSIYRFLAFHTTEQRDLFLEENEDLIKDYFML